jgi:ABC-2 type transport system ATP-binding protein
MANRPVDVRNVTKRFGDLAAVADLTFGLEPGTITGFLGPNGAGKSTTLRMIGGLLRPTAGAVTLFGLPARDPQARQSLGYMPADPAFLPHLTGRDNLDLLAKLRGGADQTMRRSATDALDLEDAALDRAVGGYSSGMRQKLAIVAAVQHRPALVVLDEPANRLDPIAHHAFCDLVRRMAGEGHTVLLSSHVLAEVEAVCDDVLLVREGALLRAATVAELRENAPRVVTVTRADGTRATTHVAAERPDLLRELLADPDVVDMTVVPASLEDVVLALYTGQGTS